MKKFLRQLSRKDISLYLILLLLACSGAWLRGYWGGFLTGGAGILLVVAIFGKALAYAAVRRIDKQVKDVLTNR